MIAKREARLSAFWVSHSKIFVYQVRGEASLRPQKRLARWIARESCLAWRLAVDSTLNHLYRVRYISSSANFWWNARPGRLAQFCDILASSNALLENIINMKKKKGELINFLKHPVSQFDGSLWSMEVSSDVIKRMLPLPLKTHFLTSHAFYCPNNPKYFLNRRFGESS